MTTKKIIIVASNKDWHKNGFDKAKSAYSDYEWYYVSTPEELKKSVSKTGVNKIFFLHWSWIVPEDIWANHECICFHMTDLPFGRGGAPLQNLIMRGCKSTTLTAFRMIKELDAGPYYMKEKMSLNGRAEEIYLRASEISWRMVGSLIRQKIDPIQQIGEPVFFTRLKPVDSALPSKGSLDCFFDKIRMHDATTYPLSFIEHGDFLIKFYDASYDNDCIMAKVRIEKK